MRPVPVAVRILRHGVVPDERPIIVGDVVAGPLEPDHNVVRRAIVVLGVVVGAVEARHFDELGVLADDYLAAETAGALTEILVQRASGPTRHRPPRLHS
jgi:hypothetical protein